MPIGKVNTLMASAGTPTMAALEMAIGTITQLVLATGLVSQESRRVSLPFGHHAVLYKESA